jgi:hypothetical protein
MEIAAPVKGDAGRVSKLKYMIYSFPRQGNPSEEEIAMHFAADLPFAISGVYLVATIVPEQSFQPASERCDLYVTLPRPQLDPTQLQRVDEEPSFAFLRQVNLTQDELVRQVVSDALRELFKEHAKYGQVPFDLKAWLDQEGNPIVEKRLPGEGAGANGETRSGLLIRAHVNILGQQKYPYVKAMGDILDYVSLRKYFVRAQRDYQGEYTLWQNGYFRKIPENSVVSMICAQGLSCFVLPFSGGTVGFADEISAKDWRPVKGCDAFDVQAEVVRIRKLNRWEEMLHGRQYWEIILFLLYCAGILLFFGCQFVFLNNCGWKPMAWVHSLGMSAMAVGFFYFLHYRRPFPYAPEIPFATAIFVYLFFVLGALFYAAVRKKKPAAMAVIMVILETIAFFCVLVALSHAGG